MDCWWDSLDVSAENSRISLRRGRAIVIEARVRNIFIGAGAYYLSWWIANPLSIAYGKLIGRVIYRGAFERVVVLPIVSQLPMAIVAAAVGACVVILVESEHRIYWALFPSGLYAFFSYLGTTWAEPPSVLNRMSQVIADLFPAVACLIGALLALRRRTSLRGSLRDSTSLSEK
jgi:hypothetical protein